MKFVAIGNIIKTRRGFRGPSYFSSITASKMMHWDSYVISKTMDEKKFSDEMKKYKVKFISQKSWCNLTIEGNKIRSDPGKIMTIPEMTADVFHIAPAISEVDKKIMKKLNKSEEGLISLDSEGFTKANIDGEIKEVPWANKEEFLEYVDILKLNIKELYYLTGRMTVNSAMELLKMGPHIILLTNEEKSGYIFYGKMKYFRIPVYKTKVKDTTGVGDVFTTAFVTRYFETRDIKGSAYFASAAASLLVEKGGVKGIADKEKVKKRYRTLREILF